MGMHAQQAVVHYSMIVGLRDVVPANAQTLVMLH